MSDYNQIANGLVNGGGIVGGAVGHGMEAAGYGMEAGSDIEQGSWESAIINGSHAIEQGVESFHDGASGKWL